MIRAQGLAKRFDDRVAVEGVTFDVAPGEVFGLLGPNGGGKTTTMRMIAGLLRPSAGTATVGGRDLGNDPEARHLLGFLTEQPGLYERLSARANLEYFPRLYDVAEADVTARVDEALSLFGLSDRSEDRAGGFSKGMRQRLALARAVLHRPRALLLDEPTSGLDPEAAAEVRDTIAAAAKKGVAIVVSTHNLAEAEKLCRRVAIVKNRLLGIEEQLESGVQRVTITADGLASSHVEAVRSLPGVEAVSHDGVTLRLMAAPGADVVPDVVALLVAQGTRVRSVVPVRRPLEERYLALVGARAVDDVGAAG